MKKNYKKTLENPGAEPLGAGHKVREVTEQKLIEAAESIFAEHGFKGATTRLIAQEANVNIALINRYFDGKYGLFMSVLEKRSQCINISGFDYPAQPTFSKECFRFLKMKLTHYNKEMNFFKIVITSLLTDEKFQKKFQEALINFEDNAEIELRFEKLKKAGKLNPKLKTHEFSEILCVQLFGTFVGDKLARNQDDEFVDAKLKTFVKLICTPYELH